MKVSMSVMQLTNPPVSTSPLILDSLPDPTVTEQACPRRARMRLDFLLLAIEALDTSGSEAILMVMRELELQSVVPDRVALWRIRSTNPLRRITQQQPLTLSEGKSLVIVICYLARRLTGVVRQYVLTQQQLTEKEQTPEDDFYLASYLERFRTHFKARMSSRRSVEMGYGTPEDLDALALDCLAQLLFCTGTSGMQRLWISLFDGEVA
jgi:Protein of unknown function (DUF3038)